MGGGSGPTVAPTLLHMHSTYCYNNYYVLLHMHSMYSYNNSVLFHMHSMYSYITYYNYTAVHYHVNNYLKHFWFCQQLWEGNVHVHI